MRVERQPAADQQKNMEDDDERIVNQIEGLGTRRLLGCASRWALLVVVGGLVLGLVVRHSEDPATRLAAMLAVSGLLFGFTTSYLTVSMRTLLKATFVTVPLVVSLGMFGYRTMLGHSADLPLRLVVAPLFISAGYLIGQIRRENLPW